MRVYDGQLLYDLMVLKSHNKFQREYSIFIETIMSMYNEAEKKLCI